LSVMTQGLYWEDPDNSPLRFFLRDYANVPVIFGEPYNDGQVEEFDNILFCPSQSSEQLSGRRHGYGFPAFGIMTPTGNAYDINITGGKTYLETFGTTRYTGMGSIGDRFGS